MKKNILLLTIGLLIGAVLMSFIDKYDDGEQQTKYIELKEDFTLSNGGILKQGTLLKIDNPASEGYTRYILYVNYKSNEGMELKTYNKQNLIKPYWMYRDSTTVNK